MVVNLEYVVLLLNFVERRILTIADRKKQVLQVIVASNVKVAVSFEIFIFIS